MDADRRLDEFAARQYGTFSREQARSAGLSPRMAQTRMDSGAWVRLAQGVYALASAPPKWERQVAAALLTKPGSLVAGRSAAAIHDFAGFTQTRPVIMVSPGTSARSPLAKVIRSHRFEDVATVRKRGFIVIDEAETLMTLARELDERHLEKLVDELLARRSCTAEQLARVVVASTGVPGVPRLRRIVDYRLPSAYQPPTSELERLLYGILDDGRLPIYSRQLSIQYQRVSATVDAYIPAWRLVVEGDGRRWHTRKADMDRDRIRDNEAVAHGLAVLRFTYDVLRDTPEQVVDTLLRTGRVRQAS